MTKEHNQQLEEQLLTATTSLNNAKSQIDKLTNEMTLKVTTQLFELCQLFFHLQTTGWADKEKEVERLRDDLEQQLETVQTALEAVKGEKDSLQAQIVTVRSLLLWE